MAFSDDLLSWYNKNGRDLPWRATKDPYKIWLSEVLLQQTRVEQGLPYYHKFIEAFGDLASLAAADEEVILRMWQGLGYYSRAVNMHQAARTMMERYGAFPSEFEDIAALKGVGDYTASAVSSIAFDLPHAVVDGNVYRFLSRYYGIRTPIDSNEGKKEFKQLAGALLDKSQPGKFNQAMMEMGALVCRPAPLCRDCIFASQCVAFKNDEIKSYPVKKKKSGIKERFFYYLIMHSGNDLYIRRREENDIWRGLYEFPLIETPAPVGKEELLLTDQWNHLVSQPYEVHYFSRQYNHRLSHQLLKAHFIHLEVKGSRKTEHGWKAVSAGSLHEYGMPQLIVKYLAEAG